MTDYFPQSPTPMSETPIVTQDDLAGLLAVAEFLDALEVEGDVSAKIRELVTRLSALVIVS